MSTKTADERLEEIRGRIDALEARAHAAGAAATHSIKDQLAALREHEASARAARHERADASDESFRELEAKLGHAESELATQIADGSTR